MQVSFLLDVNDYFCSAVSSFTPYAWIPGKRWSPTASRQYSENPLSKSPSPAVLCQHCLIHNSQMEQWGAIPFLLFVMILPLHFPFYFSNNMHDIIYSYSTVFWWLCSLRLLFKPTGMLVPYHDGINTSGFWITYHYSVHILNVED